MPIGKASYKNFYFGAGAEFHFISKFYLLGYEAHKLIPDIGVDFIVTNMARRMFEHEEPKELLVQVKSTFMIKNEARFYIDKTELETVAKDNSIVIIFCFFKPIIEPDPKSLELDFSDTFWFESEEASWMQQLYDDFRALRREGKEDLITFKGFTVEYIWLNNMQLNKALKENLFEDCRYPDKSRLTLIETSDAKSLSIYKKSDNLSVGTIMPEIQNIYYLMNYCTSTNKLKEGAFMYEHL